MPEQATKMTRDVFHREFILPPSLVASDFSREPIHAATPDGPRENFHLTVFADWYSICCYEGSR